MQARGRVTSVVVLIVCVILPPAVRAQDLGSFPARERALWSSVVAPYLTDSLWVGPRRYDAANLLMVPLHAAFQRGFEEGEREFAEHFERFLRSGVAMDVQPESELSWTQYLYLCSRFVVLATESGRGDLVPSDLPETLSRWVLTLWLDAPSWQWGQRPFRHGMRERVRWKLDHTRPGWNTHIYYSAILDSEIFVFAIAADLRHWSGLTGHKLPGTTLLDEISRTALEVYRQRVVWGEGDRWLFQPGVWTDHPDFAYACRHEKVKWMQPCRLPRVAEDASHSHRTALWLRSLASTYPQGSGVRRYYFRLLRGLSSQFFGAVAVPPDPEFPAWRTRNFMDGRNGVYRWGYHTLGTGHGYGPFELSGTILLGWWGFLSDARARTLYSDLVGLFPLSGRTAALYVGPATSEAPTPTEPRYFLNGTAELICRLAAELK